MHSDYLVLLTEYKTYKQKQNINLQCCKCEDLVVERRVRSKLPKGQFSIIIY